MVNVDCLGLPKRDEPCGRCGWRYVGFHICFDASKPEPNIRGTKSSGGDNSINSRTKATSPEDRSAKLAEQSNAYWEAQREKMRPRNDKILGSYKEGKGLREVASLYGVAYQTVVNIIKQAEEDMGMEIMRRRGVTNKSLKGVN